MTMPASREQLRQLAYELLGCRETGQTICLFPHVNLDGDALGSCLALRLVLEQLELKVLFWLDEPIPAKLDFLPGLDRIDRIDPAALPTSDLADKLALLLDCSDCQRTGRREALCQAMPRRWVIDHHIPTRPLTERDIVDTSAAACAELVFTLIGLLEEQAQRPLMTPDVATLLMTGLVSDTGSFAYSNTTHKSFAMAARLMEEGLDLVTINSFLFERSSPARLRLMGALFSQAHFYQQGRVLVALVPQALMDSLGASEDDLEGIINQLRSINGVDLALVFRQGDPGQIRVNIRSSERLDAAALARSFGGGGHPRAAGMTVTAASLEDARAAVLEKVGEL